jgi:hypothetical protein
MSLDDYAVREQLFFWLPEWQLNGRKATDSSMHTRPYIS